MFSYIIGEVIEFQENTLILENQGIGYEIAASNFSMSHFKVGEIYKVHIIHVQREDSVQLYGFYSTEEKEMFKLLTKVSAIGPKSALAILSVLSVEQIHQAVLQSNVDALVKAPGVGKKSAQRIILELMDTVKKMGISVKDNTEEHGTIDLEDNVAIEALVNLGYARNEAEKVIRTLQGQHENLEDLIKHALRII